MNKKTAYSSFKYVHDMDKVNKIKNGEIVPPTFAIVYPTNICNHGCRFCAYLSKDNGYLYKYTDKKAFLSREVLLDIPRQLHEAGVRGIEISGGGDPTLHPNIKEFIKEIKKYGLSAGLVTNGSLLDDEMIELIKDFDWVRFSINAGNAEDYRKIQRPSPNARFFQYEGIWEKIGKLNSVKSKKTLVGVSFIVYRYFEILENSTEIITNATSIFDAAEMAKRARCDNIRYSLAFTSDKSDSYEDIWKTVEDQMISAKLLLEDEGFTVFSLAINRKEDKDINKGQKPYKKCNYVKFSTIINAEGYVSDCCVTSYLSKHRLGSLYKSSFKDIWFNKKRLEHQDGINVNSPACSTCFMNEKNSLLEYLLDGEPLHVDFP